MNVADLKKEVDALQPGELAELSAYTAKRESAAWDVRIDRDFGEGGRLCDVLAEARDDIRARVR